MTEIWMPVPGWEGFYDVSDHGRIRSVARTVPGRPGANLVLRSKVLRGSVNSDGYIKVALCRDNRRSTQAVHRLVLLAFVGPQPDGMEACHFNGARTDNRLVNLRWDTRSSNTYDRIRHGTHFSARKTHCKHGHLFDEANTYRPPSTSHVKRQCRACLANRRTTARKVAA